MLCYSTGNGLLTIQLQSSDTRKPWFLPVAYLALEQLSNLASGTWFHLPPPRSEFPLPSQTDGSLGWPACSSTHPRPCVKRSDQVLPKVAVWGKTLITSSLSNWPTLYPSQGSHFPNSNDIAGDRGSFVWVPSWTTTDQTRATVLKEAEGGFFFFHCAQYPVP